MGTEEFSFHYADRGNISIFLQKRNMNSGCCLCLYINTNQRMKQERIQIMGKNREDSAGNGTICRTTQNTVARHRMPHDLDSKAEKTYNMQKHKIQT